MSAGRDAEVLSSAASAGSAASARRSAVTSAARPASRFDQADVARPGEERRAGRLTAADAAESP